METFNPDNQPHPSQLSPEEALALDTEQLHELAVTDPHGFKDVVAKREAARRSSLLDLATEELKAGNTEKSMQLMQEYEEQISEHLESKYSHLLDEDDR